MMENQKKLTKEERIEARRARVASRRSKDDPKNKGGSGQENDEQQKVSKSKAQITESRQNVDDGMDEAETQVSDVLVDREDKEALRRRKAEATRADRMDRLEAELLESTQKNKEIEEKWAEVAQKNIPQELYQQIAVQYKAASKLLAKKDAIIKDLQEGLKVRDESYVELLAAHQDDIQKTVDRMQHQFAEVLTTCESELIQTEKVCLEERGDVLQQNKKEVESLFQKRRDMELGIMDGKQKREEEFQKELAKIRGRDSEDHTILKVTLEKNIQLLEQKLEEMRATYQLNQEKLDYNHRVLDERGHENKQTVSYHRQRLRRLKEALSTNSSKFEKQDQQFKSENQELSKEYKRVTEQFKDLQKKFRHFEAVDNKKYREVWAMNEADTMEVVRKVLRADQVIHEQILGLEYDPPMLPRAPHMDATSAIKTLTSAQIFASTQTAEDNTQAYANTEGPSVLNKGKYSNAQVQRVMSLLVQESSFLVDARLDENLKDRSEAEQTMYKSDAILSSLGVVDREDLDELVGFFFDSESGEEVSVHPNDIVKICRDFVVKRQESKTKTGANGVVVKHESVASEKRARKREKERKFWTTLGDVVSDDACKVWDALDRGLHDYNKLLEERANLIEDTTDLAQQNEELKVLLQEYLGSKINQELYIPPTRLVRDQ